MLADSHVHLDWFAEPDQIVARACQAGVGLLVSIGVDELSARRTVEIAHRCPGIVAAVGYHPAYLPDSFGPDQITALDAIASDPSVGMIGEIGIDTVDSPVPLERQVAAFRAQLALARRLSLPVNLHLRGDYEAAFGVLSRDGVESGGIVHYFVGSEIDAHRFLSLGLLISIGKPVTRRENLALRQAACQIPLDRLLLETDSYPLSGRTTEPSDVVLVAEALAELRGTSSSSVASATFENLRRVLPARALAWAERRMSR
ncbi:MAG TPA: TatD family hydrolase [Chloroflexota bacterium]|nr:TatD family hydrolase [Chloroflexota bacterium]